MIACNGPCPCPNDGQQIGWHAHLNYCPMGKYPSGLGNLVARLLWRLRIPQALKRIRLYNPRRCKCANRAMLLNRLGDWIKKRFARKD